MAQWTRVATSSGPRYLDPQLARAWLDEVLRLTDPARISGINAGGTGNRSLQMPLIQGAWRALGFAFRAMNIAPTRTPVYRNNWLSAFGVEGFELGNTPINGGGWIVRRAARIYDSIYPGRSPESTDTWTLIGLTREGLVTTYGLDIKSPGTFNLTGGGSGRSNVEGREAWLFIGDWRVTHWRAPALQRMKLAPAAIWSVELARKIAQDILSLGVEAVVGSATETLRPGVPPDGVAPLEEPPGFVRTGATPVALPLTIMTPTTSTPTASRLTLLNQPVLNNTTTPFVPAPPPVPVSTPAPPPVSTSQPAAPPSPAAREPIPGDVTPVFRPEAPSRPAESGVGTGVVLTVGGAVALWFLLRKR